MSIINIISISCIFLDDYRRVNLIKVGGGIWQWGVYLISHIKTAYVLYLPCKHDFDIFAGGPARQALIPQERGEGCNSMLQ